MAIGLITTPASWVQGTPASPTWFQNVQDTLNYMLATMHCGDGSDADPAISSGTTTLTRDMYYANLTLSGGTLATAGWCIYVKGTFTWSGGELQCNGVAGGVGNSGNGVGGLTSLVSGGPHLGGSGMAGTQTAATPQPGATIIGFGGTGGAGGPSGGAGGAAGTFYSGGANDRKYKIPPFRQAYSGPDAYGQSLPLTVLGKYGASYTGGAGGGGGRGDGTRQGGSGGEGGGLLFVIANSIVITGSPTASATGGAGGAGQASGNCGGGGGGGGGAGILIYGSLSGSPPSITVTGGSGGAATGTGTSGSSGSSGSSTFKTYALGT